MARPPILSLSACRELPLAGGKAVGLSRLLHAGFPVPPGVCLTTEAYSQALAGCGISPEQRWLTVSRLDKVERESALAECRAVIRGLELGWLTVQCLEALTALRQPSEMRWAVRSSATNEDEAGRSYAGLYRTELGVSSQDIESAIKSLWASLWEAHVVEYVLQSGGAAAAPAMAVVFQPMLNPLAAGVAYSIHPVTGRSGQVVVNAVFGLAAPLVAGRVTPDHFVVETAVDGRPVLVRRRLIAEKPQKLVMTDLGAHPVLLAEAEQRQPSITDDQLYDVVKLVEQVAQAFRCPVNLEWAIDSRQLWVLQARPITAVYPSSDLTNDDCEWSRTNFKETMPEVPSPLGLSFLEYFMDAYIVSPYRRLGCRIPGRLSAVRVLHGRPYLNVTLFYSLVGQLGGDPSLNAEHMGGAQPLAAPPVSRIGRLALIRAGWLMWQEMRRCIAHGPVWFQEMQRQVERYHPDHIRKLSLEAIASHLEDLGRWLDRHEVTFGIAAGTGQCLQALRHILPSWLGAEWRSLLNAALQGQGTVISAQQIFGLADVARLARNEPGVAQWFLSDPWDPTGFRERLAGTDFLRAFDRYLEAYGHRAVGESDVATPRLAEQPESLLIVIRAQVRAPADVAPSEIIARQERGRREALAEIRRRLGRRWDRWAIFVWWYRRLGRFSALREANRHHLMYYSTAARRLLLQAGTLLAAEGRLNRADDIFFVTLAERGSLLAREPRDWKALIEARRAQQVQYSAIAVPDTIRDWEGAVRGTEEADHSGKNGALRGTAISAGRASGPACLVRSVADWSKVRPGAVLIAPVVDPGMAPLFGIVAGLVVEMGGTLSHGAIIAREYGLPAIANAQGAMRLFKDGDRVTVDADSGEVRADPRR